MPKLFLFNFSRTENERAVRTSLKSISPEFDVEIVDLVWHPPIKFRKRLFARTTFGERIPRENLVEHTNWIVALMNAVCNEGEGAAEIPEELKLEFDGVGLWSAIKYDLTLDLFEKLYYILSINKILKDETPDEVIVLSDKEHSHFASQICRVTQMRNALTY